MPDSRIERGSVARLAGANIPLGRRKLIDQRRTGCGAAGTNRVLWLSIARPAGPGLAENTPASAGTAGAEEQAPGCVRTLGQPSSNIYLIPACVGRFLRRRPCRA